MAEIKRKKIGYSRAYIDNYLASKALEIKAALLASFQHTPIDGDGTYLGVRFYNNSTTGQLVGLAAEYTPSKLETTGYTAGTIQGIWPFNAITEVSINAYDKSNNQALEDGSGNQLVEKFAKFPKMFCRCWTGKDANGSFIEYDIKATADETHGFYEHGAFYNHRTGTYNDYALLSKYFLGKVSTGGSTRYLSISGYEPIDETDPGTIDASRSKDSDCLQLQVSLFQWLHMICFADRSYGYNGSGVQGFKGCSRDYVFNGTTPTYDNTNHTITVPTSSIYAGLPVGAKIVTCSNGYAKGRTNQVTITAKEISGSNTVYTHDGTDKTLSGVIHCIHKVDTGICDSITAMHGVMTSYPEGMQPFVEFYIENPYGMKTWVDGMAYNYSKLRCKDLGDSNQVWSNRGGWDEVGCGTVPSGYPTALMDMSKFRDANGNYKYRGFLSNADNAGSSSNGVASNNGFTTGNDYAWCWGEPTEPNGHGGVMYMSSAGGNHAWGNLSSANSTYGCAGRFYRSTRLENASE